MIEQEPQPSEVVTVARHLSAIVDLAESLEAEAVNDSTSKLMPGGRAMVALGPVASPATYERRIEVAEAAWWDDAEAERPSLDHLADEDDYEPPLQSLLFWSEDVRDRYGYPLERTPTLQSEAALLKWALDGMWRDEPKWADFAKDVERAKIRLEEMLHEGLRSERGVQCFECQVDLVRPVKSRREVRRCEGHDGVCVIPHDRCPHDRGGLADEWKCPQCGRRYDEESYRRAVAHAHFVHAGWLPLETCAERTSVKAGTIKVWATRGKVGRRKDVESGRVVYSVTDVLRHADEPDIAS